MMSSAPQQPEDRGQSRETGQVKPTQWRVQQLLSLRTTRLAEASGFGELLLPFLFAAAETCWIDAIFIGLADLGLFQSRDPLMPLWAPFVFIIGSQWILSHLERRAAASPAATPSTEDDPKTLSGSSLFVLFVCVLTLFVVWLSVYPQVGFFIDPRWLFALLNDILLLDPRAYHIFFIIAVALYLCWRGVRLFQREYEPSQIFNTLRLGMGIIVAIVVIGAGEASAGGGFNDDLILLLLVPCFLFFCLSAHALARVTFERHTHPTGLDDDVSLQERSILVIIGSIMLALLFIAWLVESAASPTILSTTQQLFSILGIVYDWFVGILATVIVFLATPLFWLFEWWTSLYPPKLPSAPSAKSHLKNLQAQTSTQQLAAIVPFIKVLFPVVLLIGAIFLMRWILRRRRHVQVVTRRRVVELHESLWSWTLFWTQVKALLRMLFGRFFPQQAQQSEPAITEAVAGEPAVRSMREMYRALLARAASRGFPRKKDETPYEFEQRLNANTPLAQPQLAVVTEAYTATRYGGVVPDESEAAHIRQEWSVLEQRWREASS